MAARPAPGPLLSRGASRRPSLPSASPREHGPGTQRDGAPGRVLGSRGLPGWGRAEAAGGNFLPEQSAPDPNLFPAGRPPPAGRASASPAAALGRPPAPQDRSASGTHLPGAPVFRLPAHPLRGSLGALALSWRRLLPEVAKWQPGGLVRPTSRVCLVLTVFFVFNLNALRRGKRSPSWPQSPSFPVVSRHALCTFPSPAWALKPPEVSQHPCYTRCLGRLAPPPPRPPPPSARVPPVA